MTPTPNDPIEVKWPYLHRELRARGLKQAEIDEMPEEDAWRFIEEHPAPPQANGHSPEAEVGARSPQPEQPQNNGDHRSRNNQSNGDRGDQNDDDLPELPAAIRDGIDMWHRTMARGERPADIILELAARDLFSLLLQSKLDYPHLQDVSHQAVVDGLQEMAEIGNIPYGEAQEIMMQAKRAADDPGQGTNGRDGGARGQSSRSGKRYRQREHDDERQPEDVSPDKGICLDDFWSHMPSGQYIFVPSGDMWPAKSVNSQIPPIHLRDKDGEPLVDDKGREEKIAANKWLDEHPPRRTVVVDTG